MSELSNDPMIPNSEPEMSLVETWVAAVTKPNDDTFSQIAAQPSASTGKAVLWVFVASLLTGFASLVAQAVGASSRLGGLQQFLPPEIARDLPVGSGAPLGFGAVMCGTPALAVFSVLLFLISTGLIQWVAKLFGGTGSFDKLAYTFSAITVPYSAVSAVLTLIGIIPYIGILTGLISFALVIYVIVLEVLAIKAVNNLDTLKAVGSLLLPGLVLGFIICCCIIGSMMLLGPAIGNVFSTINQSLGGY